MRVTFRSQLINSAVEKLERIVAMRLRIRDVIAEIEPYRHGRRAYHSRQSITGSTYAETGRKAIPICNRMRPTGGAKRALSQRPVMLATNVERKHVDAAH